MILRILHWLFDHHHHYEHPLDEKIIERDHDGWPKKISLFD